ncbi:Alpha/Beta hydrolase protein [Xylogone sp. PMI_703]|nr:Alpha/Beta hydrolase protein [Xylogone sp. PMI_703]
MVYIPPLKPLGSLLTIDESDSRYLARINEEVELNDGARIRLNVYLPRTEGPKWPVLMTSSPYGKDTDYRKCNEYAHSGNQVPEEHACNHLRFEAPSPAWWCPRGYALVYWDHRGSSQSPGYLKTWCSSHFDDYAQMISWAADQPWSTGKVGLAGISYLGSNQWPTAARQPRGLACICPWEGFGDFYREAARHGGITSTMWSRWFPRQVVRIQYGSRDRAKDNFGPMSPEGELTEEQLRDNREDMPVVLGDPAHEFIDDDFFSDRMVHEDYSKIEVPVLSAGNWGGINLHLRGNVISFMRTGSKHKFLRIHTGRHDLPFYTSPYVDTMLSFFDSFLKDNDYDGWKTGKQAPVRFAVRRGAADIGVLDESESYSWRDEREWPPARTKYETIYLHPNKTLGVSKPSVEGELSYRGLTGDGFKFETAPATKEYEICGHPSARLSISLSEHKGEAPADIDVFLALRKYDKTGNEVWFSGSQGDPTPVTFGWIRASHRTLDPKPYPEIAAALPFPVLSHKRSERKDVKNGEVYDLQCELWPTNLVVEVGERLVFEVTAKDPEGCSWFTCNDPVDRNAQKLGGTNTIHIGPKYENYVVLPIV